MAEEEWWQEMGYFAGRQLEDGRWLCVAPLLFGRARLIVCDPMSIFDGW